MLAWFDNHGAGIQALTAICQAALTLAALAIAIWVPFAQQQRLEHQANSDRLSEARGIAWVLKADLLDFAEELSKIEVRLNQGRSIGSATFQMAPAELLKLTTLAPPAQLVRIMDRLHVTGNLIPSLAVRLLVGVGNLNRETDPWNRLAVASDVRTRLTELQFVILRVDKETNRIDQAI